MITSAYTWRNLGLLGAASIVWFVISLFALRSVFHLTLYDFDHNILLEYPAQATLPLWWIATLLLYAPALILPTIWAAWVIEVIIPSRLVLTKIALRQVTYAAFVVAILGLMLFFAVFSRPYSSVVDALLIELRLMIQLTYHFLLQTLIFSSAVLGWHYRFLPRPLSLANGLSALVAFGLFVAALGLSVTERAIPQSFGIVAEGLPMILFSAYFLLRWQSQPALDPDADLTVTT